MNNDAEKIRIAIDIVDNFKMKLDEIATNNDGYNIDKETMDDINKEYQLFATQKLAQIKTVKDFSQKMIKQIDEIQFPVLESYLSSRYAFSSSKYVCEHCEYVAKNQSAMSAHKRGCKGKLLETNDIVPYIPIVIEEQHIQALDIIVPVEQKPPRISKKKLSSTTAL